MVVFCLSRSKLHLYILPLVAPLALIAGRVLASRVSWRAFRNVALTSAVVFVVAKGIAGYASFVEARLNAVGRWLASVDIGASPDRWWASRIRRTGESLTQSGLTRRDMRLLGEAVATARASLPAAAPVVFWDEATNHGVTFYLGLDRGTLPERIATGPKGKFETWTAPEFAERVREGKYPHGALLIVSDEKRAEFDAALPGLPIAGVNQGRYWHLLRLGAGGAEMPVR